MIHRQRLGPGELLIFREAAVEFGVYAIDVLTDATKDREKIFKAIKKADFGNGTSLYNAVDETLRKQLAKIPGRKAVVLFTDGVDTTSRKNSYDSTLNYAEESDTLIFPIYYNTYFDNRQRNSGRFPDIFGGQTIGANVSPTASSREKSSFRHFSSAIPNPRRRRASAAFV